MINADDPVWDGRLGTAGGAAFGKGLNALAAEREVSHGRLAEAIGLPLERLAAVLGGSERVGISALARLTQALRTRPIEFLRGPASCHSRSTLLASIRSIFFPTGPSVMRPVSTCARSIRVTGFPRGT